MNFGTEITLDNFELPTLLKNCIGNESNTVLPAAEDLLSPRALIELAVSAMSANPAQQITIEDVVSCILKKLLDFANRNVLKNFKMSLHQEEKYYPIKSSSLISTSSSGKKVEKSVEDCDSSSRRN